MSAVTVLGLVQGGFLLEDIRTVVPHRTAIQIPAHLAERSQDLVRAIQQQRVMRLGAAAVAPAPPLSPALRGRGIAPHHAGPGAGKAEVPAAPAWVLERGALLAELELSREQCRQQQSLNEQLQATLAGLTAQMAAIQQTLDTLVRRREYPGVAAAEGRTAAAEAIPQFIPSTSLDAAEVRINHLTERASTSNVDEARAALRSLRGRSA